jgi:hypothetical protein
LIFSFGPTVNVKTPAENDRMSLRMPLNFPPKVGRNRARHGTQQQNTDASQIGGHTTQNLTQHLANPQQKIKTNNPDSHPASLSRANFNRPEHPQIPHALTSHSPTPQSNQP